MAYTDDTNDTPYRILQRNWWEAQAKDTEDRQHVVDFARRLVANMQPLLGIAEKKTLFWRAADAQVRSSTFGSMKFEDACSWNDDRSLDVWFAIGLRSTTDEVHELVDCRFRVARAAMEWLVSVGEGDPGQVISGSDISITKVLSAFLGRLNEFVSEIMIARPPLTAGVRATVLIFAHKS
jgi:hypothetical protein